MPAISRLAVLLISITIALLLLLFSFPLPSSRFPLTTRSPSLFPKSAIITLTDDNSTFFMARPAAFGPELPEDEGDGGGGGLNGLTGKLVAVPDGENGCGEGLGDGGEDDGEVEDAASVDAHSVNPANDEPFGYINGKIVLIPRGGCGFLEKVLWAQRRGAIAVIVGDNLSGKKLITMSAKGDTSNVTIPSIFTTHTTAQLLTSLIPSFDPAIPSQPRDSDSPKFHYEQLLQRRRERLKGSTGHEGGENGTHGLWVTLTCTPGPTSPFLDTLLVLVVSPLGTLGIVYTMLAIRSRLQRRRWRAPKSVVESLPVRVYTEPVPLSVQISLEQGEEQGDGQQQVQQQQAQQQQAQQQQAQQQQAQQQQAQQQQAQQQQAQQHEGNQIKREKIRRNRERKKMCALLTGRDGSANAAADVPTGSFENRNSESTDGAITNSVDNRTLPQNVFQNIPSSSLECVVCLEDYVPHVSRVMRLPCGHEFHVGCITPWLVTKRRTCPICKGDVVKMVREKGAMGGGIVGDADVERGVWVGYGSGDEMEEGRRSSTSDRPVETEEEAVPAHARGWVGDWWRWIARVVGGRRWILGAVGSQREGSFRALARQQRAGEVGGSATAQAGRLGQGRGIARALHETQINGSVNERTPLMTSRIGGNGANGTTVTSGPGMRD